jgi:Skp family chaperone for outer membrane proteins
MSMHERYNAHAISRITVPSIGTRGRLGKLENEENRTVKRTIGILAGLATLGIGAYLGSQVFAQQGGTANHPAASAEPLRTRIAVVNVVQVLKKYSKFQNADADIKRQIQETKTTLDPLEKQVRALQAKAQLPETPAAERDNIKRDLERLTLQYREKAEDADKALTKRSGELAVQIFKELEDAVDLFARSNAIELVMMYNDASKSNEAEYHNPAIVQRKMNIVGPFMPMYVDPRMDITEPITQMLNRRVASNH